MKIKLLSQIAFVTVAALSLTACASTHEKKMSEPMGAQASPPPAPPAAVQPAEPISQNEVVIPLHEETVTVGKRTVDAGQVTIHKKVTKEVINQPVELRSESLMITREPAGAAAAPSSSATPAASGGETIVSMPFEEGTITIQLQKEEPVVQKNTVVSGQVVARKNAEVAKSIIQSEVRRENIQWDKSTNAQNVTVAGDLGGPQQIKEAAGAEKAPDASKDTEKTDKSKQ